MLVVSDLETGYGKRQVLHRVTLRLDRGEIVGVVGPNGAGKSTLLKVIAGTIRPWCGTILVDDRDALGVGPHDVVRLGVALMPQGCLVFPNLTVEENLQIAQLVERGQRDPDALERVLETYPDLRSLIRERAGLLSGGEQHQVALARMQLLGRRYLLLDEPTAGLSPKLKSAVFDRIRESSVRGGSGVLMAEHSVAKVIDTCSRIIGMKDGKVSFDLPSGDVRSRPALLRDLFLQ